MGELHKHGNWSYCGLMALLHNSDSIDNFVFFQYTLGNSIHEDLLDKYISSTDIKNNKTRKELRVDQYDNINGALFLVVHKERNEIDAMSSCVKYNEHGILSAKVWHRLHIKNNVPTTVLDVYFEEATYKWCHDNNVQRLWVVFNESTPRIAHWAAGRMGERRNANRPNKFSDHYGHAIRTGWRPYDKLIYERNTWQYVIYYSPDPQFFLTREEKPLNIETTKIFKREFPNATRNWNELQRDNKVSEE